MKSALPAEPTAPDLRPGLFEFNRHQFMGMRSAMDVRKPDPSVRRNLRHGWLMEQTVLLESVMWGRWDYWMHLQTAGQLPEAPIPQIDFLDFPEQRTRKMLEASLNCIPRHGEWRGWSSFDNFRYFLDWLLYGFGNAGHKEPPVEPSGCEGASDRLYQVFNVGLMLLFPNDYFGDICAEMSYGKHLGFFPTPMSVAKMMAMMVIGEGDHRAETFCDPCVGTGRFPLLASNHCLRLFCQDISKEMCLATMCNAYLYAPWLARPIAWLEERCVDWEAVSDAITAQAPAQATDYLAGSEFDRENAWKYLPVIKRRYKEGDPEVFKAYKRLYDKK